MAGFKHVALAAVLLGGCIALPELAHAAPYLGPVSVVCDPAGVNCVKPNADGSLNTTASTITTAANAGSDATQATAVQGITGGKAVAVSLTTLPNFTTTPTFKIDQTTDGTTNRVVAAAVGTASLATSQVTLSTTAATAVAARTGVPGTGRQSVTFSVKAIGTATLVCFGPATVTTSNGLCIPATIGASYTTTYTGLTQAIVDVGTTTVIGVAETY